MKKTYSVDEAAQIFGVTRRTIYRRIKSEDLAAVRPWEHAPWRIPVEAIRGVQSAELKAGRQCEDCIFRGA